MGKKLTDLTELCVACARQGRTVASLGGMLTSKEQEGILEIYSRLTVHEKISKDSPVKAIITSKTGRKRKMAQGTAIKWFIKNYPGWSRPLQEKLRETLPPLTKTILAYGLDEGRYLSDEFYVQVLKNVTNLPYEQSVRLYHNVLKPQMDNLDELLGMTETEIKKSK